MNIRIPCLCLCQCTSLCIVFLPTSIKNTSQIGVKIAPGRPLRALGNSWKLLTALGGILERSWRGLGGSWRTLGSPKTFPRDLWERSAKTFGGRFWYKKSDLSRKRRFCENLETWYKDFRRKEKIKVQKENYGQQKKENWERNCIYIYIYVYLCIHVCVLWVACLWKQL